MTDFTFVQTGDINDGATFGNSSPGTAGVDYPASASDTITASGVAGTITVPVGYSVTIGAITGSGTGANNRIRVVNNGDLTLAANAELGRWNELVYGPDSTLDLNGFDLLYTVPDQFDIGGANKMTSTATEASPARVLSTGGEGRIELTGGGDLQMITDLQWVNFQDCGFEFGSNTEPGDDFRVRNCTFTDMYWNKLGGWYNEDNAFRVHNNDWRGTRVTSGNAAEIQQNNRGNDPASDLKIDSNTVVYSGAVETFVFRHPDVEIELDNWVASNAFIQLLNEEPVLTGVASCPNSLLAFPDGGSGASVGGTERHPGTYVYTEADNPHTLAGVYFVDGVLEATYLQGFSDDGDHLILSDEDIRCERMVVIESQSGVLMNALGVARSGTYENNHNTLVGNYDEYGALFRTENGGSITGTLNMGSNLCVNTGTLAGSRGINITTAGDDQVSWMDYNAWVNFESFYFGVTSATKTPGVDDGYGGNDITDDPQFFDGARKLAAWDTAEGSGTGTAAAAITYLAGGLNGYDSATKSQVPANITGTVPADLVAWVRAGFAPTNQVYADSAHDTGAIGAVAFNSTAVTADIPALALALSPAAFEAEVSDQVTADLPALALSLAPQPFEAELTAHVTADLPALTLSLAPRAPRAEPVGLFVDVVRPAGGFDPGVHLGADEDNDPNVVTGDQLYAYASTGGPLTTLREDTSFVMADEGEITYSFWDATDNTWGAEQTVPVTEERIGVEADIPALVLSLAPQPFQAEVTADLAADVPALALILALPAFEVEVSGAAVPVGAIQFTHRGPAIQLTG